jgi:hypothetical protein
MLTDGVKAAEKEESVKVMDIAELVEQYLTPSPSPQIGEGEPDTEPQG